MSLKVNKGLLKGSIILLVAFNIFNALNFFFHFALVRMLTVVDYGVFATLFAIIYILAVFTESFQIVITKFTTNEGDKGKLKNVLFRSLRKSVFISLFMFVVYLLFAIPLSPLLKIDYSLLALNGLMIFLALFTPVTRGLLQGTKRFKALGFNMIIESVIKFAVAITLVFFGLKVFGAILGTLIGVTIAFFLSFINLRDIIAHKEKKASIENIYEYSQPAFVIVLIILAFYSIDIVMAKIFFSAEIAGAYAIASMMGKTIFFGTQPISRAMFPLSAEQESKKKSENVFINALVFVCIAIVAGLVLFYFFPGLIIRVFSGRVIPESVNILFFLGVAMSLVSLANLILLYKLSIGKVKGYQYLIIFLLLEVVLLTLFSNSLLQFSIALITASAAFLWGSIMFLNEEL